MDRLEKGARIRVRAGARTAEHFFVHGADERQPIGSDVPHPEHLADVLGDLPESGLAFLEHLRLLAQGMFDLFTFTKRGEQAFDLTGRPIGSEQLIGRHVVQVATDRAAIDDRWVRANDVEQELGRE